MCSVPIASSVRSQLRIDTIPVLGKVLEHLYRYSPSPYAVVDRDEDSDESMWLSKLDSHLSLSKLDYHMALSKLELLHVAIQTRLWCGILLSI